MSQIIQTKRFGVYLRNGWRRQRFVYWFALTITQIKGPTGLRFYFCFLGIEIKLRFGGEVIKKKRKK